MAALRAIHTLWLVALWSCVTLLVLDVQYFDTAEKGGRSARIVVAMVAVVIIARIVIMFVTLSGSDLTWRCLFAFSNHMQRFCRSPWPRNLWRWSAGARSLGLRVRIPPGAWASVCCECCVLSGRGLCFGLITRPEESYRPWCVCVWSWSLDNEAVAHWGGCCAVEGKTLRICVLWDATPCRLVNS